jgi:hypothetical protein
MCRLVFPALKINNLREKSVPIGVRMRIICICILNLVVYDQPQQQEEIDIGHSYASRERTSAVPPGSAERATPTGRSPDMSVLLAWS